MRKHASRAVVAAVGAIALAATVAALVDRRPASAEQSQTARATPVQSAGERRSVPPCESSQLHFRIDVVDIPAAVLEHVGGPFCSRADLPLRVRIVPRAGQAQGELFGPEGILGGTFAAGEEHVAGFHYRPTCEERGPFVAVAVTGRFAAGREIPTDEPCFPAVQRKVVALGPGRDADAVRVEALAHAFTVRVALPRAAQVTIALWDVFGAVIRVLDDEIGRRDCHRHGETDVCVYHFPIRDTHSPGMWRVVIRKTSPEPATVRFRIAFEAVR
ncbi:MAG TPA: hypothetical protein VE644_03745 [Gaiellaceae bacterium]|nr:hypothetical protein [Gaiellaceae bacterium]